ncbi:MAG TPA: cyclic nucleotide-binding domain-containing protein [Candidatus Saccharimonadia bacterium]|nr:cyclic nucleotide-binding domain-containing protein [Candidatus Saccharimonadia bacterium]
MVNLSLFRQFPLLASLPHADRGELSRTGRLGSYQPGQVLFNRGDTAKTVVFLLSGTVELQSEQGAHLVEGDKPEAKNPIAQGARRAATATCIKPAQVLFIDRERLDLALTWSQTGGVEVLDLERGGDEEEEQDWMTALLQSQSFHRIPAGNIAQIFAAMRPAEYDAGAEIVRQGDPGDFYYVITSGRVGIVRDGVAVTELGGGKCFGEEALVSGEPRNATVRALTKVGTMRLAAADFERLLRAPVLREIGVDEIPNDAVLIDVRLPQEFTQGRLPGALNLPLVRLRDRAHELEQERMYVVYCDSGRRSASATYLLCERGFDARHLAGGIPADEMPVRG